MSITSVLGFSLAMLVLAAMQRLNRTAGAVMATTGVVIATRA